MGRLQRRQDTFLNNMETRLAQVPSVILNAKQGLEDSLANWNGYNAIETNETQRTSATNDRRDTADDAWLALKPNLEEFLRKMATLKGGTSTAKKLCQDMIDVFNVTP